MTEIISSRRPSSSFASRLLSCIRLDEAFLLQGAPLIGASCAIGSFTTGKMLAAALLAAGSLCLVAHVYAFNDWAGIQGDLRDPNRAARTFAAAGVSRGALGSLVAALLVSSLLLISLLGTAPFVLALAIIALSALYSAPAVHGKGRPFLGSALHLVGGTLHFLLGYATFGAVDARGVAIGVFFGLVFAAGHLTHEARDREGDLLNGIRTNAVAFGTSRGVVASLVLFTAAYALLVVLAMSGMVPRLLVLAAVLYPVHLYAALRAMRTGLTFRSLRQLQRCYRMIFAAIGAAMVVSVLSGW
jgi:4-hydroxybenzoate polyprenyltransferase